MCIRDRRYSEDESERQSLSIFGGTVFGSQMMVHLECSMPVSYTHLDVYKRQAAYMACGLAAESGEPVALSCTGATASRNYLSGLTEAFYRHLPILAITSTQPTGRIGHNIAQVLDRSVQMKDIARLSAFLPVLISTAEEEWAYTALINKALLELRHRGGGPVHINLETLYTEDFSVTSLPEIRKIDRITYGDKMPLLKGKVAVFVGAHEAWSCLLYTSRCV